jgi:hypothetical protein
LSNPVRVAPQQERSIYGQSRIPGLVPLGVPNLHDTIDPRQRDQTHTGEIALNDVWNLTPSSELQLSGFFRTYNLSLRLPLRILMADDNRINQKVGRGFLEKLGYRSDVVGNGLEVIEALQRQPYDLIFLDIQMPEMDGYETARQIQLRWTDRPRIIARVPAI